MQSAHQRGTRVWPRRLAVDGVVAGACDVATDNPLCAPAGCSMLAGLCWCVLSWLICALLFGCCWIEGCY